MSGDQLAFIGSGHIAQAMIEGAITHSISSQQIVITGRDSARLMTVAKRFSVRSTLSNSVAVEESDVVFLCVKPTQLQCVCEELATVLQKKHPLVISVAAGVSIATLARWLGPSVSLVRAMPNILCAIGNGVTSVVAHNTATLAQVTWVLEWFQRMGMSFHLNDEMLFDVVTALSGCGPAYVFLFMECLQKAAVAAGLDSASAEMMTQHTVLGAARMAMMSKKTLLALRQAIASPGGATESALRVLENSDWCERIATAFQAAEQRARAIGTAHNGPS